MFSKLCRWQHRLPNKAEQEFGHKSVRRITLSILKCTSQWHWKCKKHARWQHPPYNKAENRFSYENIRKIIFSLIKCVK